MKERIEVMVEAMELVRAEMWADNAMDIIIDDRDTFDWDEIEGLSVLLDFLSEHAIDKEYFPCDSCTGEYHFEDGLTVSVYSMSYED